MALLVVTRALADAPMPSSVGGRTPGSAAVLGDAKASDDQGSAPPVTPIDPDWVSAEDATPLTPLPTRTAPNHATAAGESPARQGTTLIDPNWIYAQGPYFDVTAEALLWRLEPTWSQAMILNPVLGRTVETNDLDLGFQAGPRVNMAFLSDEPEELHAIEVGYFGIYNWVDRDREVAPAGSFLRFPDRLGDVGATTDFCLAEQMDVRYAVNLNSVELNFVFGEPRGVFHWMLGPRFIRLEERFDLYSFTAGRIGLYEVGTRNDLWGAQWAARWRQTGERWEITAICKIGIFDNQARQSTFLADNDRTEVLRDSRTGATVASFVLDAGISLARRINDYWSVLAGYNVFVIDNVARATDQLDFSNSPVSGSRLFLRNDAVAHGMNFGIEARW